MIRATSKEESVNWASRCPAAEGDVIEIREVFDWTEFPEDVRRAATNTTVQAQLEKEGKRI